MEGKSGGLFDVSLTEMLGFEQVPCLEGDSSLSKEEFLSFVSRYNIKDYENAVCMVYEQHVGPNHAPSDEDSFSDEDGSLLDSDCALSDSEDSNSSSFNSRYGFSLLKKSRSHSSLALPKGTTEMTNVTRWFGVFLPTENALYLESPPSSALHNDCLTDILDVAECINCFKVYIGIQKNRLDVVKRYLFAGFEISKKGQLQKLALGAPASVAPAASAASGVLGTPGQNHILLEYEL